MPKKIPERSFFYKLANTSFKIIAFLVAGIYSISQVLGTVALGAVYDFITGLGIPETAYTADEDPSKYSIRFLENLFDTPFFVILNLFLFAVAIVGTLILTRKRSFYSL